MNALGVRGGVGRRVALEGPVADRRRHHRGSVPVARGRVPAGAGAGRSPGRPAATPTLRTVVPGPDRRLALHPTEHPAGTRRPWAVGPRPTDPNRVFPPRIRVAFQAGTGSRSRAPPTHTHPPALSPPPRPRPHSRRCPRAPHLPEARGPAPPLPPPHPAPAPGPRPAPAGSAAPGALIIDRLFAQGPARAGAAPGTATHGARGRGEPHEEGFWVFFGVKPGDSSVFYIQNGLAGPVVCGHPPAPSGPACTCLGTGFAFLPLYRVRHGPTAARPRGSGGWVPLSKAVIAVRPPGRGPAGAETGRAQPTCGRRRRPRPSTAPRPLTTPRPLSPPHHLAPPRHVSPAAGLHLPSSPAAARPAMASAGGAEPERPHPKPFLIGVSGGTASGKVRHRHRHRRFSDRDRARGGPERCSPVSASACRGGLGLQLRREGRCVVMCGDVCVW